MRKDVCGVRIREGLGLEEEAAMTWSVYVVGEEGCM
jgi:hypothetical protein